MTVEETERPKDMAATGQSLATMDSEQLLQSMQKDLATAALIGAGNATGKRTPRKRTKSAKLAEAEEVAAEMSWRPAKKIRHINSATPLFGTPLAGDTTAPATSGSPPRLFKPVRPKTEPTSGDPVPGIEADMNDVAASGAPAVPRPVEQQVENNGTPSEVNKAAAGVPTPHPSTAAGTENVPEEVPAIEPPPVIPPAQDLADDEQVKLSEDILPPPGDGAQATPGPPMAADEHEGRQKEKEKKQKKPRTSRPPQEPTAAIAGTAPLIPFPPPTSAIPAPFDPATQAAIDQTAAEQLLARHMQAGLSAAAAAASTPEAAVGGGVDGEGLGLATDAIGETSTKYTGVRRNKGGRYSARIKIAGTNKYLGSFKTAEEAARAFDEKAVECGRPCETLNFPAAYGGPTVGQAYRKRKVHKLYGDPQNHINVLLQKLADVDRSNPGILRLTLGTLGVPEERYLPDNKYAGIRKQSSHWETRIRFKDKLYSMGFYASVEAAALAWDITAASLRERQRKLNFPEVKFADLEQQLDALKCVIAQTPGNEQIAQMPIPPAHPVPGAADGLAPEPPRVAGVNATQEVVELDATAAAEADLAVDGPPPPPPVPDSGELGGSVPQTGDIPVAVLENVEGGGSGNGGVFGEISHHVGVPQAIPNHGDVPEAIPHNTGVPEAIPQDAGVPEAVPNNGGVPEAVQDHGGAHEAEAIVGPPPPPDQDMGAEEDEQNRY